MDKYGFIVDGKLEQTFNSSDFVAEDIEGLKAEGHKVMWVKILYESQENLMEA